MSNDFTYQEIAEKILELINSDVFPRGTRLPGQSQLAKTFGVSRVRVREAIISLEVQGYIRTNRKSSAYVIDNETMTRRGLPKVTPLELTEARALIEAESAALAAPIISEDTISELEKYVSIMSGEEDNDMTADDADAAFHRAIAHSTGNKMIIFMIESMWEIRTENAELQKVYRLVCAKDSAHREQEHLAILQALKDRNPVAARKAMRSHFTTILKALLKESEAEAYREIRLKASKKRSRFLLTNQIAV